MRLTRDEIIESGINLKAWLGAIQRTAREENKVFAINGPMQLQVRRRRTGSVGPATSTSSHAFFGGERFRIGGVLAEEMVAEDCVKILVSLVPADLELAGQISGMTLPLQDCFANLEGFEEWVGSFDAWKDVPPAAKKAKPLPLKEERAANPMWGAW